MASGNIRKKKTRGKTDQPPRAKLHPETAPRAKAASGSSPAAGSNAEKDNAARQRSDKQDSAINSKNGISSDKVNREQRPDKKRKGIEVKGILLSALGVILMLAFFRDNSIGVFGALIKSFTFGLFGWPAYFVPSVIIIAGFLIILSNRGSKVFGISSVYILLLFTIASALLHTFYYDPAKYVNQNPFILLTRFYFEAQKLDGAGGGGGFLGALLAMPFLTILRAIGTRILLAALLIVDILLLTNVSAATFIKGVGKTAGRGAHAIGKRYAAYRQRRASDKNPDDFQRYDASADEDLPGGAEVDGDNLPAGAPRARPVKTSEAKFSNKKARARDPVDSGAYGADADVGGEEGADANARADRIRMNQEVFFHTLDGIIGDEAGDPGDGARSGIISFPSRISKIRFSGFDDASQPPPDIGPDGKTPGDGKGDRVSAFLKNHDLAASGSGRASADDKKDADATDATGGSEHEIVLFPQRSVSSDSGKRIKKPPLRWSLTPGGQVTGDHARRFFSGDGAVDDSDKPTEAKDGAGKKTYSEKASKIAYGGNDIDGRDETGQDKRAMDEYVYGKSAASGASSGAAARINMAVTREIKAVGQTGDDNTDTDRRSRIHAAMNAVINRNNTGGWEMLSGGGGFVFDDESGDGEGWSAARYGKNGHTPGSREGSRVAVVSSEKTVGGFSEAKNQKNNIRVKPEVQPADRRKSKKRAAEIKRTGSPVRIEAQYRFPPLAFLDENPEKRKNMSAIKAQTQEIAVRLEETLLSFKVRARVINVTRGPSVTQYEVLPDVGVKVNAIVNLAEDISLKLGVTGIRIAPVADRSAIGIEVPNKEVSTVYLRDLIAADTFLNHQSKLAFAVGVDISGNVVMADISKMPHLLIAGATGSGKSVFVNCLILSLLYRTSPDELKMIMIDPKVVELGPYNGIPHLMIPVVTDPRKAAGALSWAVQEMLSRYQTFSEKKVKDLNGYNAYVGKTGDGERLPRIVIIIDELADLMMAAPKEVQDAICRLAQMARAAGMHLIVATQRPTVDVITGLIKSNIPSRIAFRVASQTDSRVILDANGAEKLLGRGDMLFYPVGEKKPLRVQGALITETEMERVVEYIKVTRESDYDEAMIDKITGSAVNAEDNSGDNDELLPSVIEHVVEVGQASTSMIQRKFKVGYSRAARMIDQMEARGIVSGFDGSKPRQILISKQQLYEMKL